MAISHKEVEEYVLSMPNATLDYPFGKEVAVYKVFVPSKLPVASRVDGVQGENGNRANGTGGTESETRKVSTQQSATSADGVSGSARKQSSTARGEWKMFALIAENSNPVRISLKCDPTLAKHLREKYESVMEGYHLNKRHWNTIVLSGQLSWNEVQDLIRHSYNLVTQDDQPTPQF